MKKVKINPNTSPRYGGTNGKLLQLKLLDGGNCFIDACKVIAIIDLPAIKGIGGDFPRRTRIDMADNTSSVLVEAGAAEVGILVEKYVKATP